MNSISSCFVKKKPVIGMIHTKGINDADMMDRAKREIDIYESNGVDGIMVEPYYGTYHQVEMVLRYLEDSRLEVSYGVNCLNVDCMGFELANRFHCDFLQMDSVVGHVKPRDEETMQAFFDLYRPECKAALMGGVRFKYQPVLSDKSLEEDLQIAQTRCDAVCVTEDATGQETSMSKIMEFRAALGNFPLYVCAGVTPHNIVEQSKYADGFVVGSYFKDTYKDSGDVCASHVIELMDKVREIRASL